LIILTVERVNKKLYQLKFHSRVWFHLVVLRIYFLKIELPFEIKLLVMCCSMGREKNLIDNKYLP